MDESQGRGNFLVFRISQAREANHLPVVFGNVASSFDTGIVDPRRLVVDNLYEGWISIPVPPHWVSLTLLLSNPLNPYSSWKEKIVHCL